MTDPTLDLVIDWINGAGDNFDEASRRCELFNREWADPSKLAMFFAKCGWTAHDTMRILVKASAYTVEHWSEFDT